MDIMSFLVPPAIASFLFAVAAVSQNNDDVPPILMVIGIIGIVAGIWSHLTGSKDSTSFLLVGAGIFIGALPAFFYSRET